LIYNVGSGRDLKRGELNATEGIDDCVGDTVRGGLMSLSSVAQISRSMELNHFVFSGRAPPFTIGDRKRNVHLRICLSIRVCKVGAANACRSWQAPITITAPGQVYQSIPSITAGRMEDSLPCLGLGPPSSLDLFGNPSPDSLGKARTFMQHFRTKEICEILFVTCS